MNCFSKLILGYILSTEDKELNGSDNATISYLDKSLFISYELFVDEQGRKISKSIGNGISIDEWLRYANPESLALFMYKKPTSQKKLHFDVIPKHVEEYYQYLGASRTQSDLQSLNNPVRYIHREKDLPNERLPMSYNLLLNLASVANAESKEELWNYISSYNNALSP